MKSTHFGSIGFAAFLATALVAEKDANAFTGFNHIGDVYTGVGHQDTTPAGAGTTAFLGGVFGDLATAGAYVSTGVYGTGPTQTFFLDMHGAAAGYEVGGMGYAVYPNSYLASVSNCDSVDGEGQFGDPHWLDVPGGNGSGVGFGCWLVEMKDSTGSEWNKWGDSATIDYAYPPGSTQITGRLTCRGNASASARCFHYSNYLTGGSTGSQTAYDTLDLGADVGGPNYEACLLRSVNGQFRTQGATTGGVEAANLFGEWGLSTGPDTGAYVDCIQ